MKFRSILIIRHKADDLNEAHDAAIDMGEHLLDTCNDNDTIDPRIQVMTGGVVVVKADVLEKLIEAADYAQACAEPGSRQVPASSAKAASRYRGAARAARAYLKRAK
jgi:hypothetical protein